MAGQERTKKALNEIFYPQLLTSPSCLNLPTLGTNVNLKLEPHYIQMLPKFIGLEDAYLFLSEFEEVCNMIHFHNVNTDVVKLRFVPFALKDNAKRWMYSLPANSISNWNDFIKVFLRKYFPNGKTVKLRNEINQFIQFDKEPFWRYMERFKNLLAQCPHHGLEQCRLCQIVYEGLDQQTRTMLESMCQGGFLTKNPTAAWEFLEDLAEKTMQWETTRDDSLSSRIANVKGGLHAVSDLNHIESRFTALENQLKGLTIQQPQIFQSATIICSHCQSPDHTLSACPHYAHQLSTGTEQVNMAYQRPRNDPFAPTYNPGWRNHPNFSWSQGQNL